MGKRNRALPTGSRLSDKTSVPQCLPAAAPTIDNDDWIKVVGACAHNLQSLDVRIPSGRLTVVSGVSGCGKSSLVFDTLYAEGRRRYGEPLLPPGIDPDEIFARSQVERIENLPPTICLSQSEDRRDRRATLATLTETWDLLQNLFARAGRLICPTCGEPVGTQSRAAVVEGVLQAAERTKVLILAPLVRAKRGAHTELFPQIVRDGYVRARVDGDVIDAASPPTLSPNKPHTIEAVIDRLVVKAGLRARLEESLETALSIGEGTCIVSLERDGTWEDRLWSTKLACSRCQQSFPPIELRTFSLRSAAGVCSACDGWGRQSSTTGSHPTEDASPCPECQGARLGLLGRSVRIAGCSLPEFVSRPLDEWESTVEAWRAELIANPQATPEARLVAERVLPPLRQRLQYLCAVGLGYLTLSRPVSTLSHGELQRARLASVVGGELQGLAVLLDEPTAGLHPQDSDRVLSLLRELVVDGNTAIVVEHDLSVVLAADWVIELGPEAGRRGGRLVAEGTPMQIAAHADSPTGAALRQTEASFAQVNWQPTSWLRLEHCRRHNLQDVTLELPLGGLVGIAGVSGSGKSTLILETLAPLVQHLVRGDRGPRPALEAGECTGTESLRDVRVFGEQTLARGPRSTVASTIGLWDEIRRLFARTPTARLRGFTAARFSDRDPEGQCPRCKGRGVVFSERTMNDETDAVCPECHGRRFNRQTLTVRWKGLNVADVLALPVSSARDLFAALARLHGPLQGLCDLGLGYLVLGQPARSLSGGEAQRLLVAQQLARSSVERAVYLLDEPTSGLHQHEIDLLFQTLRALTDAGHSVVVIEHHLELLARMDWLIELGPGAGPDGGRIIASGLPRTISSFDTPTGRALDRSRRIEP